MNQQQQNNKIKLNLSSFNYTSQTFMEIAQEQSIDSIRFIYNNTPKTKVQQAKSYIHPAFHYTPLEFPNINQLQYNPLMCSCQAVMNRYCQIDFNLKTIKCCICGIVTNLPANYAKHIQPGKLPYELMPSNTTFQYKIVNQKSNLHRQSYMFVLDTTISQKQLTAAKEALIDVIKQLPDNTNVGLIVYHRYAFVYQLSSKLNMIYCINSQKQYPPAQIADIIGIGNKGAENLNSTQVLKRFIVPIDMYREKIIKRIKDVRPDGNIYVNERSKSCLGQALNIAITIAQMSIIPTRITLLVGGPCTHGPGKVISTNFKQQMRSPQQVTKGQNMQNFHAAKKYYDSLTKRVLSKKIIIDLFALTLNQMGLSQMIDFLNSSGGLIVMHQQFADRIFKQSFPKIFLRKEKILKQQSEQVDEEQIDLNIMTEGTIQVYCSKEVTINGALGHCYGLNKMKPFVSEKQIGKGKTHAWYLGSLDTNKTITIAYETKEAQAKQQFYYIQIKTNYRNRSGQYVTRITTVQKIWTDRIQQIAEGFDEQAAVVYLGRICINKALYEEQKNIRQWLDQILCKWAQYYSNFIKNDQSSFSLPNTMKKLPQLVYHLRRSHFVNRFGISLDESYYIGYMLNRESIVNTISMIQPALLKYSLENYQPQPVPLDQQEMQDQVILLLDSYFNVIQWYGQHVQSWFQSSYHQQEGYEHIRDLLQSPKQDIDYIMNSRFPVPNFYKVHPNHSKERYLKSRVNPKKSGQNQNTLTDDSDLTGFMHHLIKVVVRQT